MAAPTPGSKLYATRETFIYEVEGNVSRILVDKNGNKVVAKVGQYIGEYARTVSLVPFIGSPVAIEFYELAYATSPKRAVPAAAVGGSGTTFSTDSAADTLRNLVSTDNKNTAKLLALQAVYSQMRANGLNPPTSIGSDLARIAASVRARQTWLKSLPSDRQNIVQPVNPTETGIAANMLSYIKSVVGISGDSATALQWWDWAIFLSLNTALPLAGSAYLQSRAGEIARNFALALQDGQYLDNIEMLVKKYAETQNPEVLRRIREEAAAAAASAAGRGYDQAQDESQGFMGETAELVRWLAIGFVLVKFGPEIWKMVTAKTAKPKAAK
jgi:hypothetical protein